MTAVFKTIPGVGGFLLSFCVSVILIVFFGHLDELCWVCMCLYGYTDLCRFMTDYEAWNGYIVMCRFMTDYEVWNGYIVVCRFMTDYEAWNELCDLYLSLHDYANASFCLEELIMSNPHNHLYHQKYADVSTEMASFL